MVGPPVGTLFSGLEVGAPLSGLPVGAPDFLPVFTFPLYPFFPASTKVASSSAASPKLFSTVSARPRESGVPFGVGTGVCFFFCPDGGWDDGEEDSKVDPSHYRQFHGRRYRIFWSSKWQKLEEGSDVEESDKDDQAHRRAAEWGTVSAHRETTRRRRGMRSRLT